MRERDWWRDALVAMMVVYSGARVLQVFPTRVPTLLIVVLHVVPPAVFALIHGRRVLGTRGILVFMGLCVGGGSFFESLGLRTGFPFGNYYFTGVMGPKVFQLPILLALAYVGVGYVAWVVASLIVGGGEDSWRRVVVLPLIAAVTMSAWDLAMDPVWTNIDRAWVWERGGGYFGVPFSNFFGWLLTTWVFYQVFALWGRGREVEVVARGWNRLAVLMYGLVGAGKLRWGRGREVVVVPQGWNRLAVLMYGLVGAGNLLLAFPSAVPAGYPTMVADATGRRWLMADLVGNCVLMSVFLKGPLALVAWVRAGAGARGNGTAEELRTGVEDWSRL